MSLTEKIIKTVDLARAGVIFAPASFKSAETKRLIEVCNGCGAASAKIDFVPDTIYGLYIGYCCHVHDWQYEEGKTEEDREEADRIFKNNMIRIIDRACKKRWFYRRIKWLMYVRANSYYKIVRSFGGAAFWSGKNN